MTPASVNSSKTLKELIFTRNNSGENVIYTHSTHSYYSMPETIEHRNIRTKILNLEECDPIIDVVNDAVS